LDTPQDLTVKELRDEIEKIKIYYNACMDELEYREDRSSERSDRESGDGEFDIDYLESLPDELIEKLCQSMNVDDLYRFIQTGPRYHDVCIKELQRRKGEVTYSNNFHDDYAPKLFNDTFMDFLRANSRGLFLPDSSRHGVMTVDVAISYINRIISKTPAVMLRDLPGIKYIQQLVHGDNYMIDTIDNGKVDDLHDIVGGFIYSSALVKPSELTYEQGEIYLTYFDEAMTMSEDHYNALLSRR
jgi:hypothetical protein